MYCTLVMIDSIQSDFVLSNWTILPPHAKVNTFNNGPHYANIKA